MEQVEFTFGKCTNCLVTNCYFTGVTEKITHDGTKEKGDKAINIMGGNNITISNNYVEGNVLDAISVASNAQYVKSLTITSIMLPTECSSVVE